MLRRFVVATFVAVLAQAADAGIISSVLTFNGQTDQINTINNPVGRSSFLDQDSSGSLNAGDIVFGWIASTGTTTDVSVSDPFNPDNPVNQSPLGTPHTLGQNQYLASVFSGVVNDGPNPGSTFLTAVNPGANTGLSIPELLSGFGTQLNGVTNASLAVLSGSTANGVSDLADASLLDFVSGNYFSNSDFDLEFAATLDGGFFENQPTFGSQFGQRAGANVIASTQVGGIGSDIVFLPEPTVTIFDNVSGQADLALDNTFVTATPNDSSGFVFTVQSSSIRVNAVPEPSSMLAFAGIAGLGYIGRRRRNAAKAA